MRRNTSKPTYPNNNNEETSVENILGRLVLSNPLCSYTIWLDIKVTYDYVQQLIKKKR